jgi:hypothetical protein
MLQSGKGFARSAAWLALLGVACLSAPAAAGSLTGQPRQAHRFAGRPAGKPAYVWLWYADGGPLPEFSQYCSDIRNPSAYQCNFGSYLTAPTVADCQRQVQSYLDDWYKDFNVVFTVTRPVSSDYYMIAITSGWHDCAVEAAELTGGLAAQEGGIAPGNSCVDLTPQTAIAIACGDNALDCATIIAHEQGHLAGLMHTANPSDVMYPVVQGEAKGWVNEDMETVSDPNHNTCGPTQNSYNSMLLTLGAWPGGAKPALVFAGPDAGVPDAATADAGAAYPDAANIGRIIGSNQGPSIDGSVTVLSGFDAYSRPPPPPMPDAAPTPAGKSGGCNVAASTATPSVFVVAVLLLGWRLLLPRRRLSRSVTGRARARRP